MVRQGAGKEARLAARAAAGRRQGVAARGGGEGWRRGVVARVFACGRPRTPSRGFPRRRRLEGEGERRWGAGGGEERGGHKPLVPYMGTEEGLDDLEGWVGGGGGGTAGEGGPAAGAAGGSFFYEPLARSGSGRGQNRPRLVERQNSAKRRVFGRAIESRAGSRGARRPADCVRAARAPFRRMELTF